MKLINNLKIQQCIRTKDAKFPLQKLTLLSREKLTIKALKMSKYQTRELNSNSIYNKQASKG